MFTGLKSTIANSVANGILRGVAASPDVQATALGSALAFLIAAKVNYGALFFQHDWSQLGILLAAVLVWALGYVANRNTVAKHVVDAMLQRIAELEAASQPEQAPEQPK